MHILEIACKRNPCVLDISHGGALLEKFHKTVSKLYSNQYVFTGTGIIFTHSSIILILIYEIFPIGSEEIKVHLISWV